MSPSKLCLSEVTCACMIETERVCVCVGVGVCVCVCGFWKPDLNVHLEESKMG